MRRRSSVLALALALGCGSGAEAPPPTTPPPATPATPAPPTTVATSPARAAEPPTPAPDVCVRTASCCHGYLAALGIGDASVQSSACAPFTANVWDADLERTRCAEQNAMWRDQLEALGQGPIADCAAVPPPPPPPDAPSRVVQIEGIAVEPHRESFVVHATDVATIERVLSRGMAPFAFEAGVRADATLAHGAVVTLPDGTPFTRALAYMAMRVRIDDPESDWMQHLVVLVGSTESRVLVVSATDYEDEPPSALTLEATDAGALRATWTTTRTGGELALDADSDVHCSARYAGERTVTRWEARCELSGEPSCAYAAVTEDVVPGSPPTVACTGPDAQAVPPPAALDLPATSHAPLALELVVDPRRGLALRDHAGTDFSQQLRRTEGDVSWLCDDAFRVANARRDQALRALEAEQQMVGRPEYVTERRELPDFASMRGNEGNGEWFMFFARDHGTWAIVETTFVETLTYGEQTDEEQEAPGRRDGVPVALDLVPGGATELIVPLTCDDGATTRCDGIAVCGTRDATTQCRALPLRVTRDDRLVSLYDAVRFDLAGHLALTPHGGTEEVHEITAWLAEEPPPTE